MFSNSNLQKNESTSVAKLSIPGITDTREEWIRRYGALYPHYERFASKLRILLEDLLMGRSIKYQVVEARPKTIDSFGDKLDREGKSYADPLSEMTDLAGARIIVYYANDVAVVSKLVDEEFRVDAARSVDKSAALAPDQFGYLSVHKIVTLSAARAGLLEWRPVGHLTAEIQIRSVLQHSWAAISHALQYKHESDVPTQFRRRLLRVSGLLELADQEFGSLRDEQAVFSEVVAENVSHGNLDLAVDVVAVREFIAHSQIVRELIELGSSAGIKVIQRDRQEEKGVSQLTHVATLFEISTIAQLESELQNALPKQENSSMHFGQAAIRYSSQSWTSRRCDPWRSKRRGVAS